MSVFPFGMEALRLELVMRLVKELLHRKANKRGPISYGAEACSSRSLSQRLKR
jgi:hypothetical protein